MNEKHIEKGLHHKNLRVFTVKYPTGYRKQRSGLVVKPKKQANIMYLRKELATAVIMYSSTTAVHTFGTRLGFKQDDVILIKQ